MKSSKKLEVQILESIETALQASEIIREELKKENISNVINIMTVLNELMASIKDEIISFDIKEPRMSILAAVKSCTASLSRINEHLTTVVHKAIQKMEFEFQPLLKEMFARFYFWTTVYGNETSVRKYYEEEIHYLFRNSYIEEAEKNGIYKYDLSIVIRGYNKLEYTKLCVESLLKNLPKDLSYELILVNHGSSDGTKEYFESIKPNKQLDIEVNGGGLGAIARIIEGKYFIQISNDIIITKNSISNLYKCISSDESIAWVVPSTSNVSNFQSIDAEYNNFDELYEFVNNNNKSDKYRWEQRVRLVNPVDALRSKDFIETRFYGYFYDNSNLFPDDRLSLLFRRQGKKMILAKDSYCHHFGSITHGSMNQEIYNKGRVSFKVFFGIDPWAHGFCYDLGLFDESFILVKKKHIEILGINCGIGSNSLKIKELAKEVLKNEDIILVNATSELEYAEDLTGISDVFFYFENWEDFDFSNKSFDYIIMEGYLDDKVINQDYIVKMTESISDGGYLILCICDIKHIQFIKKHFENCIFKKSKINNDLIWGILKKE